ncbi:MAG TPA: hypothetical protein VHR41_16865 [Gemmatimonadales bacterium]|jgi:hypothetical protein|nr:hypothetical protein [Gemmatimonadales bacterium]
MTTRPRLTRTACVALACLVAGPRTAIAQAFAWKSGVIFYGDNTEFFNPYRTGQTILGAQLETYLSAVLGPRTEIILGAYGNHLSGRSDFLDTVKPLLGFRYRTKSSLGVLGTLVTEDRHGYLEPLEVSTLEFTRPVEYGLQWREDQHSFGGEIFIDWQHLNTRDSREVFDYGLLLHARPTSYLTLEFQGHGLHHGGQLYTAGVPVTNNEVAAGGVRVHGGLPVAGASELAVFLLGSHGNIEAFPPAGRPDHGHGTYVRGSIAPHGWAELFTIQWWGRDFLSDEGDNSYGSTGSDPAYYRSSRRYQEYGIARRTTIESAITLDTELRFHRFDDLNSIALGHSKWEYSYRLVVRAPFEVGLGRAERD